MNARWLAIALAFGAALVAWLVSRSGGAADSSELQQSISAADAASETVRSDELPRTTTRDAAATESAAATGNDAAPNVAIAPGALRVRVLDHEGRPLAGERVFVSKRGPWERSREARELWTAASDDAGRARWPEAAATLAQLAGSDASTRVESGERAEGLAVFLDGYVPDHPFVAIERAEELAQEIVLRAPRTGSVELRVTTPLAQPAWFGYARLYAWSGKGDRSGRRSESDPSVQGRIEDGVVRFPRVQLGVPLRATASLESGIEGALDLAPLTSHGEARSAELRLGEDGVTVRVRILAEDGSPLPRSRDFRVKTFRGDEWRSDRGGYTDPDSVLWIPAGTEGPAREEFRVTIDGYAKGQAEVRVKIEHARGLIDAGDVLLRRGGVALAGRVRRASADPSQSSASASLELFVEPGARARSTDRGRTSAPTPKGASSGVTPRRSPGASSACSCAPSNAKATIRCRCSVRVPCASPSERRTPRSSWRSSARSPGSGKRHCRSRLAICKRCSCPRSRSASTHRSCRERWTRRACASAPCSRASTRCGSSLLMNRSAISFGSTRSASSLARRARIRDSSPSI